MDAEKCCQTCAHQHVCLKRGLAIFMLFIQTGRYDEAQTARDTLNIGATCTDWAKTS